METLRILIVEDEVIIGMELTHTLESLGYQVIDAIPHGEDAIEVARTEKPDLILMDINLAGKLDGIETAKAIAEFHTCPLIFLTAYSQRDFVKRALALVPAAYLIKPCKESELEIAVDLAFRQYQQTHKETIEAEQPTEPETNSSHHEEESCYILKDAIFMRNRGRFEKIRLDSICFISAEGGNYTRIFTEQGDQLYTYGLQKLLDRLTVPFIVRVHRSHAVNLHHVDAFSDHSVFIEGKEIPIGKSYRNHFTQSFLTLK